MCVSIQIITQIHFQYNFIVSFLHPHILTLYYPILTPKLRHRYN